MEVGLLHHEIFWLCTNILEENTASVIRGEVRTDGKRMVYTDRWIRLWGLASQSQEMKTGN